MRHVNRCLLAAATSVVLGAAQAQIVNIDSRYGFTYDSGGSDPAPQSGQHINLIGSPALTLALGAGSYEITNAWGEPGASFSAWSYNVGTSSWIWAFVMADNATRDVVFYEEAGRGSSAAAVAALPAVQNFSTTFTLTQPTTLLFTLRDYYVPDNAGGISLRVSPVPEPVSGALMAVGLALIVWRRRRAFGSR